MGTRFDSFNHILKVDEHPLYGEVYLLTGSGMEDSFNTQMITNDLIDPYNNGLSVWNLANAQGHREPDFDFNNFGAMSLYKQSTNRFYVMYYGMENVPSIMEMDGNTGSGSNLVSFYPWQGHFDYQNNMVNGMVWSNEDQDEIVFSGYHLQPTTPPGPGFPFLARYGLATGSLWNEYPTPFDGAGYANLAFDFIVRPINHANPTHPEMLNQIYYRPKALVPRSVDTDYVFAEPWQDKNTGTFGLALLQTGQDGDMECSVTIDGLDEGFMLNFSSNFESSPYPFEIAQATVQVSNANLTNDQICESLPKPFMKPNGSTPGTGIQIYPNPASGVLSLSGLSGMENAEIVLYDLQGRIVLSQAFKKPTNTQQLDVSALESGVYFVKVSTNGETVFAERVVKE